MADIFISYAREDRDAAKALAKSLEGRGWDVWWDRVLGSGQHVHRVIEEQLESAKCVIVLWSNDSVASDWVIAEAEDARQRGVLVPVAIDKARPPLVFRQLQTADLRGWSGEEDGKGLPRLLEDLVERLGLVEPEPPPPEPELPPLETEPLGPEPEPLPPASEPEPPEPEPAPTEPEPQPPASEPEPPAREPEPPRPGPPKTPRPKSPWLKWLLPAVASLTVLALAIWWPRGPAEPPPELLAFEAVPESIAPGEPAQLVWKVRGVKKVMISARPRESLPPAGELEVEPVETTTYSLVADAGRGRTVKGEVTVHVAPVGGEPRIEPRPRILSFTAEPAVVLSGQPTMLRWQTENAEFAEIPELGRVEPSGSKAVPVHESRAFMLEAVGPDGARVSAEAMVRVKEPHAPGPPTILSFTASQERIRAGDRVELRWRTEGAERVELFDPDGPAAVEPNGAIRVAPRGSYTYSLRVTGPDGETVRRTVRVEVEDDPAARTDSFTMRFPVSDAPDLDRRATGRGFDFEVRRVRGTSVTLEAANGALLDEPPAIGPPTLKTCDGLLARKLTLGAEGGYLPLGRPGTSFCVRTNGGLLLICKFQDVTEREIEISCASGPG